MSVFRSLSPEGRAWLERRGIVPERSLAAWLRELRAGTFELAELAAELELEPERPARRGRRVPVIIPLAVVLGP